MTPPIEYRLTWRLLITRLVPVVWMAAVVETTLSDEEPFSSVLEDVRLKSAMSVEDEDEGDVKDRKEREEAKEENLEDCKAAGEIWALVPGVGRKSSGRGSAKTFER
jgi:hypothetical protein